MFGTGLVPGLRLQLCLGIGLSTIFSVLFETDLFSQSFRVESQVCDVATSEMLAESLTLYDGGLALDFSYDLQSKEPREVIIYDSRKHQLILLDYRRQVKLVLESYELVRMLEEQRRELAENEDLSFLVDPQLREQMDLAAMTIELSNAHLTYRVTGQLPRDGSLLVPYYEYLDVFARLSVTDPQRLPPFTRIAVNQSLRKAGWIPAEVELWIHSAALPRHRVHWKSQHHTGWTLSDADRQRIEQAKRNWLGFKSVSLRDYRNLNPATLPANSTTSTTSVKKP
ncbi:MAG TPA: hypothetical protein PKD54_00545 [Pirellulaceae bacterium]|nr:hypothetical protein [Pirellulaceae bacterium]